MSTHSRAANLLMSAYDKWLQEEHPDPETARAPLRSFQQALHECLRKGGRLASVPMLLHENSIGTKPLHAISSSTSGGGALFKLSSILPELCTEALLCNEITDIT